MDPNSKDFKDLQAKWYKKLKNSGFEDAEQDETQLKSWSNNYFTLRHDIKSFKHKERYYQLAGQFLFSHTFPRIADKLVWQLHSEGHTVRKIAKLLKKQGISFHPARIQQLIKKYAELMIQETDIDE